MGDYVEGARVKYRVGEGRDAEYNNSRRGRRT